MDRIEKYFVFSLVCLMQFIARSLDLTTVWLVSTWGQKQISVGSED